MRTLIVIGLIVLFLGPLRRPFFRHIRVTLPAAIGLLVGLGIAGVVAVRAGLSPPIAALLAIAIAGGLAVSFGEACKNWCDRNLPKKR